MSIETRRVGKRTVYVVRPPDGRGGRLPAERFFRKRAAEDFHDAAADAVKLGPAAIERLYRRTPTFTAYLEHTWLPEHAASKSRSTRVEYAATIRHYLAPTFGDVQLADITVGAVKRWRAALEAAGAPPGRIQRARIILGQVLAHAVEDETIAANPVIGVRATRPPTRPEAQPFPPAVVERLRRQLADDYLSQVTVSILAYAGLRPAELHALRWQHVRDRTLLIEAQADRNGGVKDTKTRAHRVVELLDPLAEDLAAWKAASGDPAPNRLVIPRPSDRGTWTRTDWSNWRARVWRTTWLAAAAQAARDADAEPDAPTTWTTTIDGKTTRRVPPGPKTDNGIDAAVRAGIDPSAVPRPYVLRHSFASLLLAAGRAPHDVAQELGHGAQLTINTYGHAIAEYKGRDRIDPDTEIRNARETT